MTAVKTELKEPEEYFLIGQDDQRLAIYLRHPLFKALEDFAKRESQREQVGLLVGRISENSEGQKFMLVEDAIEAPLGDEATGRFEESLWKRARRIAAARHPNRVVVGWFHTHLDGEMSLTEEERGVHKRFFPEQDHVLYVLSDQAKDRNFFFRQDGEMTAAEGFRIFGKTPANSADEELVGVPDAKSRFNTVGATPEQQSRQVDRSLEKIQKRLANPPMTAKDFLILGLLVANGLLIWFRPNPPVKVDNSALQRGQSELSAQVGAVENRISKLERRLGELALLDEQLKLAAGMEDIDLGDEPDPLAEPVVTATAAPLASANQQDLAGGQAKITLYKVKEGDILGVLVDKFYPDGPAGTMKAFARFNRLKGPNFDIFPGDTLKVPAPEALRRS